MYDYYHYFTPVYCVAHYGFKVVYSSNVKVLRMIAVVYMIESVQIAESYLDGYAVFVIMYLLHFLLYFRQIYNILICFCNFAIVLCLIYEFCFS